MYPMVQTTHHRKISTDGPESFEKVGVWSKDKSTYIYLVLWTSKSDVILKNNQLIVT